MSWQAIYRCRLRPRRTRGEHPARRDRRLHPGDLVRHLVRHEHHRPLDADDHRRLRAEPRVGGVSAVLLFPGLRHRLDPGGHRRGEIRRKTGVARCVHPQPCGRARDRTAPQLRDGYLRVVRDRAWHGDAAGGDQSAHAHRGRRGAFRVLFGDGPAGVRAGIVPESLRLLRPDAAGVRCEFAGTAWRPPCFT